MKPIWITPTDRAHWLELRMDDLTSTDIAALFGCSPYTTYYEVWHRKRHRLHSEFDNDNERMKWGTRLESVIANGIAEDNGWHALPLKDYARLEGKRIGSSFDFKVAVGDRSGVFEIKNVDGMQFSRGWEGKEGADLEAPPHIEIQAQHQLAVSGLEFAKIAALVGGNRPVVIHRERDEDVIAAIFQKAAEFWKSIDEDRAPEPDLLKDANFIAQLYKTAEPGKIADLSMSKQALAYARAYKAHAEDEKAAKANKDACKAQLLMLIQDAEKAYGAGFTISAGTVGPAPISYMREPYRMFKVTFKKEK